MSFSAALAKPLTILRNAVGNLRRYGWRKTILLYQTRVVEAYRDRKLGVRTRGFIDRRELGHTDESVDYDPIDYGCLDRVFTYLRPQTEDVFLDYGCGKGRVVVTAATYPFAKVLGIELSPDLSEAARENVASAGERLCCRQLHIVTADATTYDVPDDVTVVFLFNPFTGSILSAVQDNLRKSLLRCARPMQVVYVHPLTQQDTFAQIGWLKQRHEMMFPGLETVRVAIYESRAVETETTENLLEEPQKALELTEASV